MVHHHFHHHHHSHQHHHSHHNTLSSNYLAIRAARPYPQNYINRKYIFDIEPNNNRFIKLFNIVCSDINLYSYWYL